MAAGKVRVDDVKEKVPVAASSNFRGIFRSKSTDRIMDNRAVCGRVAKVTREIIGICISRHKQPSRHRTQQGRSLSPDAPEKCSREFESPDMSTTFSTPIFADSCKVVQDSCNTMLLFVEKDPAVATRLNSRRVDPDLAVMFPSAEFGDAEPPPCTESLPVLSTSRELVDMDIPDVRRIE